MNQKNMGGLPPHVPTDRTRQLVKDFYAAGIPQVRIAQHLEIDDKTLRKHYRAEMDLTLDGMTSALATNLYQDAMNGSIQSREFWLKTRGRWSFAKAEDDKKSTTDTLLEKLIEKL